jgi:hypothetical protein
MSMQIDPVQLLGGGGVGAGLLKLGQMLLSGTREGNHVKALRDTIDTLSVQQDRFEKRLDQCEQHHKECEEARLMDRAEIEALRQEIDMLMGGKPAVYKPSDLKRVGGQRRKAKS